MNSVFLGERNKELDVLLAEISMKLKDITASIDRYLESTKPVERTLKSIKRRFPSNIRRQLGFEETDALFIVRPKGFLGTEDFARSVNSPIGS